jgi:hypothetical protein
LHNHLITLSARTSTFGGIVRPICLAVFQIDDELEFLRLLNGEIRRLGAFQNLVHIGGGAPVQVRIVDAVEHKPTGFHKIRHVIYRR